MTTIEFVELIETLRITAEENRCGVQGAVSAWVKAQSLDTLKALVRENGLKLPRTGSLESRYQGAAFRFLTHEMTLLAL